MGATKNRNTPRREGNRRGYLIGADVHAFAGCLAALNSSGFAVPFTAAAGLVGLGVFARELDNTGGAAGAETIEVERGIFRFDNSEAADEISIDDIGQPCYGVNDHTVALTDDDGGRSAVGIIDDVDESGVWVSVDPLNLTAMGA